jgi:hypothetical protein
VWVFGKGGSVLRVSAAHPLRDQVLDSQAEKLRSRVTEHHFRLPVYEDDQALIVDDHDPIWGSFENQPEHFLVIG